MLKQFDELCGKVPELRSVEARAFGYRQEFSDYVPRCRMWLFCNGPDYPSLFFEVAQLLWHDTAGLGVAERHLLEVLPDCRECACQRSTLIK
jgi:hypothetical protein